jgi:hypothetical protein
MSKDTRASRPATALYKHPRKPVASKEEREKSRKSLKSYNIYGGGDDAS